MKVSINQIKGNISHVVLDGRLDVAGTQAAEVEFNTALAAARSVIVDLSKVSFIASLGIRLLVAGAQAQSRLGGKMVLMDPDKLPREVLKTTGIDQLIPVCNGLDDALVALTSPV